GVRFDAEEFLRVPITAMVGERDTSTEKMRGTKRVKEQGGNRIERARNWVEAMQAAARECHLEPTASVDLIPDGDHSFKDLMDKAGLGDRAFARLFGAHPDGAASADHG